MNQVTILSQRIGNELKQALLNQGLTQADVGEKSGIAITHCSRLERGISNPSLLVAYRICQALQIKLDDLFTAGDK